MKILKISLSVLVGIFVSNVFASETPASLFCPLQIYVTNGTVNQPGFTYTGEPLPNHSNMVLTFDSASYNFYAGSTHADGKVSCTYVKDNISAELTTQNGTPYPRPKHDRSHNHWEANGDSSDACTWPGGLKPNDCPWN